MTVDLAAGGPGAQAPAKRRSWWPTIAYPAAFPLSIIVLIWGESEVNLVEIVRPVVVTVAGTLGMTFLFAWLAGDRRLGAIATSALMIGLIVERAEARVLLVIVACAVVLIGQVPQGRILRVTTTATRLLELIATISLAAALLYVAGRPGFLSVIREPFLPVPGPADRPVPPVSAPDIFVYLLDGYPGTTAARLLPGLDATALPTALAERGFTVHDDARTNYLITRIVLASMFEERHIADIADLAPPHGPDQAADARRLRSVMEQSAGLTAIRTAGYDVVWISSGWSHLDIRTVDRRIEAPGPNEFEMAVLRHTGLGDVLQTIDPDGFADVMRTRIDAAYEAATAIAAEPHDRPRFVFVHVPAPHPPTLYKADGSPTDASPELAWDSDMSAPEDRDLRRQRTAEHVAALGRLTIRGVDGLRSATAAQPVVVIFSDHGTDIDWDPKAPLTSDMAERTSTFLATLTPGHPELFREPTTPVNIIGTLTNAYMGTSVPHRPDVTYAYDGSVLDVVRIQTTPGD